MVGYHSVLIFESTPTHSPDAEERWLRRFYGVDDDKQCIPVSWPPQTDYDTVLEFESEKDTELE